MNHRGSYSGGRPIPGHTNDTHDRAMMMVKWPNGWAPETNPQRRRRIHDENEASRNAARVAAKPEAMARLRALMSGPADNVDISGLLASSCPRGCWHCHGYGFTARNARRSSAHTTAFERTNMTDERRAEVLAELMAEGDEG